LEIMPVDSQQACTAPARRVALETAVGARLLRITDPTAADVGPSSRFRQSILLSACGLPVGR